MANKVTIEVEALLVDEVSGKTKYVVSGLDDVGKAANDAQKQLDKLGKKKVHPVIDADNNKLLKKLRDSDNKVARLAGKTATVTLKAVDKVTSIVNKLEGGLKKVVGKTWTTVVKIKDLATAPLKTLKNTLFSIKSLVMAITAGLAAKQLIVNPIQLADAYSSAQIGFSTLLGESAGQQMMDQIDAFAKATPFKTSGVIDNVQKMMAYGWDVDRVIEDMETIGDAAAATGKGDEGLASIVYALSEIRSKGKLSTQELNQLASAGIKAKAYLAEGLGFGTDDAGMAKLAEALEDGAVGANQAIDLILEGMKEFDGMMDKTANETAKGLWGQIEDTFEINIFRKWGQGLQDGAKRGFGSIVELLDKADIGLSKFGDMVYDIGQTLSNWAADKLENAVALISEITDTYEFQNGSLGEKISMLWKGLVVDPLKEWWNDEETIAKAGELGAKIGAGLTKGILAILGVTDIFDESGLDEDGGMNVAQSFAKGFVDGFDVSAITDKFVQAIKNVWGALPTWAQVALGLYGGAKIAGGISSLVGGVASFVGGTAKVIGSTGNAMVAGSGVLGTLANVGYGVSGSGAGAYFGAGMSGGAAALTGLGTVAGGVAGAVSAGKGILDLIGSYKAMKAGDETESKAKASSGGGALAGVGTGAAIGTAIAPGVGTAIGAGIGGILGWIAGDKAADKIRENAAAVEDITAATRDLETEEEKLEARNKLVWENIRDHMGDVTLSLSEIERLVDQIVWGENMGNYETFTSAVQNAESSLKNLKSAAETTNRWMWKAGLGVKFNDDEIESFKASFNDYINSAKSFVENKHYEFTAAVDLLVDIETAEGKSIIDSGNAFFNKLQEDINSLGTKLSDKVEIALKDGVITLDEQAEITNLQQQIAKITSELAQAETKAELELITLKFGGGKLDPSSYDNFMAQMQVTLEERMAANDEAFVASVSNLNLQLSKGAITPDEYNKQLQTIVDGYTAQVDSLKVEIMDTELKIIGDSYSKELGENAKEKLQSALEKSLADGIDPIEWTTADAEKYLGVSGLQESTYDAIATMLSGVADQLELVEVDGELFVKWKATDQSGSAEEQVKGTLPETVEATVGVNISAEKNIQSTIDVLVEDFDVPEEQAATIALLLTGEKEILSKIDTTLLADELGVPPEVAETIIARLTGEKDIEKRVAILGEELVEDTEVWQTITVNLQARVGKVVNKIRGFFGGNKEVDGSGYRGGIFGGESALEGYATGGLVSGGAKLIKVAEEGTPEMIIPLGSHRRDRAMKLWEKAGEMLNVPGFARGGLTRGNQDEGIRFHGFGSTESSGSGKTIQVDVGGVAFQIQITGTDPQSIAQAIKDQVADIAEDVAGIMADAFAAQFENTPVRGGVA